MLTQSQTVSVLTAVRVSVCATECCFEVQLELLNQPTTRRDEISNIGIPINFNSVQFNSRIKTTYLQFQLLMCLLSFLNCKY